MDELVKEVGMTCTKVRECPLRVLAGKFREVERRSAVAERRDCVGRSQEEKDRSERHIPGEGDAITLSRENEFAPFT
jgi:hypothetical protein